MTILGCRGLGSQSLRLCPYTYSLAVAGAPDSYTLNWTIMKEKTHLEQTSRMAYTMLSALTPSPPVPTENIHTMGYSDQTMMVSS